MLPPTNFMARAGRPEDLAACYALYEAFRPPWPEASCRVLRELWRGLFCDAAIQFFLVENRAEPSNLRIVSFAATAFVTDEFCSKARSALPPYLGMEIAGRLLSHDSPTLSREQVARDNAGEGLN